MILGVTGLMGSGKSEAGKLFQAYGFNVIDCDKIVADLYYNRAVYSQVISKFGNDILDQLEHIDKAKLRDLVFNSPGALNDLEFILRPHLMEKLEEMIIRSKVDNQHLIILAPLLYERGLHKLIDKTLYIYVEKQERINRLLESRTLTIEQIEFFDARQIKPHMKFSMCDYIILNSSREELDSQVKRLIYRAF